MNLLDWIFDNFFAVMIVFFIIAIVGTLWVYDGDFRCLVAQCRIVKD